MLVGRKERRRVCSLALSDSAKHHLWPSLPSTRRGGLGVGVCALVPLCESGGIPVRAWMQHSLCLAVCAWLLF